MTDPRLQWHLTNLLSLLTEHPRGWWPYVEHRAAELAKEPALSGLPALIAAEWQRMQDEHKSRLCGPRRRSTNEPEKSDAR